MAKGVGKDGTISKQNFWKIKKVLTRRSFMPRLHGTGPLRDLIKSVPKRSHESGPKLFQIARPFTWDRIVHQIAKMTAVFVERHLVVEDESPPRSQNIEE